MMARWNPISHKIRHIMPFEIETGFGFILMSCTIRRRSAYTCIVAHDQMYTQSSTSTPLKKDDSVRKKWFRCQPILQRISFSKRCWSLWPSSVHLTNYQKLYDHNDHAQCHAEHRLLLSIRCNVYGRNPETVLLWGFHKLWITKTTRLQVCGGQAAKRACGDSRLRLVSTIAGLEVWKRPYRDTHVTGDRGHKRVHHNYRWLLKTSTCRCYTKYLDALTTMGFHVIRLALYHLTNRFRNFQYDVYDIKRAAPQALIKSGNIADLAQ